MRFRPVDAVDHFNTIADAYDSRFGDDCAQLHDLVLDRASADGVSPSTVLDVGCGTGSLLARVATDFPEATLVGLDPAAAMVAVAAERVPGAVLHVGRAEEIPVASGTIDVAFCTTSFAQWFDQRAGLREVARVLRPGGRLYLAEHLPPGWLTRLVYRVPHFRTADQLSGLLAQAALRAERMETVRLPSIDDDVLVVTAVSP
ncbi:class I SAM-dependent methyltransferase [Nonomuraea sp. NPDC050556]|uniref:class I SAM-dependent methyltransferase n=1 Tax=Nonomuraea sp. NPDC050556 TaxID=3364369 RepID=UPI00378B0A86